MCNETAGNRINAGEIQNENRFLIFLFMKNKNCQPTKNTCDGRGGQKREWRDCKQDGGRLAVKECSVLRVFVKLSLAEMLRQQEAKACLYHGRHVFKELS